MRRWSQFSCQYSCIIHAMYVPLLFHSCVASWLTGELLWVLIWGFTSALWCSGLCNRITCELRNQCCEVWPAVWEQTGSATLVVTSCWWVWKLKRQEKKLGDEDAEWIKRKKKKKNNMQRKVAYNFHTRPHIKTVQRVFMIGKVKLVILERKKRIEYHIDQVKVEFCKSDGLRQL